MSLSTEDKQKEREEALLETLPPRLPWVLLCHKNGHGCGRVWTVNRLPDWRPAVRSVIEHEKACEPPLRTFSAL